MSQSNIFAFCFGFEKLLKHEFGGLLPPLWVVAARNWVDSF